MSINSVTIPKLGSTVPAVSLSGSTNRSGALSSGVVRLQPTVDCYVKFGNSTVTAATTDHFLFGGGCYDFHYSDSYIAAITSGATGTLNISELV